MTLLPRTRRTLAGPLQGARTEGQTPEIRSEAGSSRSAEGSALDFRILGPLQVLDEGRILPLGGAKQRATLAILLLARNQVVSRDHLIDGLWGASPPPTAGPTLETYVSRLRRVLPDDGGARLVTQPPGYRLRIETGELDLERFETLLDQARRARASGDLAPAADDLRAALSLFRGAPLEDLAHAPFAPEAIGRLDDLRLSAIEERLDADLALGRHAEVIGELESLAARNPFRERLWAQLMLALYRSGRQAEALNAFDRARRILGEELGLEPSQALKHLHRQILRQDPSLEPTAPPPRAVAESPTPPPPAERVPHRRRFHSKPRAFALVGVALLLAVTLGAVFIPRVVGGGGIDTTDSRPGTALIDLATGKEIASIPLSRLGNSAYPIYAGGHFWVNEFSPAAYVEIDPRTGGILRELTTPPLSADVGGGGGETLTPFAVQGNTLWAGSGHDLVKMDIDLQRVIERFHLDDYVGGGSGFAEGVAVGGGSVWVSRDVGRGQIVRLDSATGAVQHRFDGMTAYLQLAYRDGSLWAGDERGIVRIDAEANTVTPVSGIRGNKFVAAGGGFGWTSDERKGVVYKVDQTGHLVEAYTTGLGAAFMAYTDGGLWVGNHDEGTVTGIDAVTGKPTTLRFSHPVETISAGDGVLLVHLPTGPTVEKFFDSFTGTVGRFFADAGELGQGDEPALNTSPGAIQIDYATCAMLLNYPDKPGPEGRQLRPEVAARMPTVSPDRRTYTFTVRHGYAFSPPSNQPVTAETFRYSIERALSPELTKHSLSPAQNAPGPRFIDDIRGERAFRRGRAEHISGLRASGDALSITLTKPSPDFLERLALPFFCPVPRGTPFVGGWPAQGECVYGAGGGHIVSAGPYYVANYSNEEHVILKHNPNYHGPRPHALDAIAILEGVGASIALDWTEHRGWDGTASLSDPLLDLGGAVDRRWGAGSAASGRGDQRYVLTPLPHTRFVAFNARRGIFVDRRVRRAAALALDRRALAAAWGHAPTDQIVSPALPAYHERDLYPLRPSLAEARALMHGRRGHAVMPVPLGCDQCSKAARLVENELAAIGIDVEIRTIDPAEVSKSAAKVDLIDAETGIPYPDSASFLAHMFDEIPSEWVPAGVRARVEGVAGMRGDGRQAVAASLADHLATEEVPVAAYGTPQTSQFIGPRIGCRVFSPFAYGLDLAATCVTGSPG
jgi:DNA-binding SARP family transcriptional activator/ABC-type transport system substrate-binding protein